MAYELPRRGWVRMAVYDLLGRRVSLLTEGVQEAGVHSILWKGVDAAGQPVSSGIYLVGLTGRDFTRIHKVMVLR